MGNELVPKPGWFCTKLLEKPVKSGFSTKFKEAVPKAEVLEQPQISIKYGLKKLFLNNLTPEEFFQELENSYYVCKRIDN